MVVKKFRRVEDMAAPSSLPPLEPGNLRIACELTELAYALHPWKFEPGVYKYRSFEEAFLARQKWEATQIRKRHKN